MSSLAKLVDLYRSLKRPQINSSFSVRIIDLTLTKEVVEAVSAIWSDSQNASASIEILVGVRTLSTQKDIEELVENCDIKCRSINISLHRSDRDQFYLNLSDFISRNKTLGKGTVPSSFYLVEDDYFHGGTQSHQKPEGIIKIEHFCRFIRLLKQTSDFTDSESEEISKAVFVVKDEDNRETSPKTISLEFTENLLELGLIDLTELEEVASKKVTTHRQEKLSTFRVALWEVMSQALKEDSDIYFIAVHWDDVMKTFNRNYELYIKGFSFSKFSGEIQDFVHENMNKAHNSLSEISVKTLIVPSLFVFWLYVLRMKTLDSAFNIGLCATIVFCAIVIIFVIDNQQYFIGQLSKASMSTFKRFTLKTAISNELPNNDKSEIKDLIDKQSVELNDRLAAITFRLTVIRVIIWLFVLVSFYATVHTSWAYHFSVLWVHILFSVFLVLTLIVFGCKRAIERKRN